MSDVPKDGAPPGGDREEQRLEKGRWLWQRKKARKEQLKALKAELIKDALPRGSTYRKKVQREEAQRKQHREYQRKQKNKQKVLDLKEVDFEKKKDPKLPHINHSILEAQAYAKLIQRITEAREDPCAFIEFVMRDPRGQPIKLAPFQREWVKMMWEEPRIFIEAPRGHGKSTNTIAFLLYMMGKNPNVRIKLLGQNDQRARERLYEIRINLESNAALRLVFPNLKPGNTGDWTKSRLFIDRATKMKDPTLEAVGITSSIVGSRVDVIVADDVCVTPATMILTPDGFREANGIHTGDFVVGGDGRPHRVTARKIRHYEGKLYRPRIGNSGHRGGLPFHFWGTANHPVLTTTGWRRLDALVPGDALPSTHVSDGGSLQMLRRDFPKTDVYYPQTGHGGVWRRQRSPTLLAVCHTPAFWRLVGYYVAEGYAHSGGHITYTLNRSGSDDHTIRDIKQCVHQVFARGVTVVPRGKKAVQLTHSSREMVRFLRTFGGHAHRKQIPEWVMRAAPRGLLREMVTAIFRGDGTTPLGRETILKSASHKLLLQVGVILRRLGCVFSIRKAAKPRIIKISGYTGYGRRNWTLRTPGLPFGLLGCTKKIQPLKRATPWSRCQWTTGAESHCKIAGVVTKNYCGPVINFQVAGVHTYSHGLFTSHNCDLRNSIMYPSLREMIKAKFLGELMPTLEPDGKVITIGTPWSVADIYNLLRTTPGWKHVKYAIGTPEDPFAPLWPARWPREALIKKRAELGSLEFDRAYRCQSISGEAVPCHPDWIRYYTRELIGDPNKLVCIQGYDLAISQAASADYFACTTILYDPSRNLTFVADAWRARLSFAEQASAVIAEAVRWRPDVILIERVGLGGALENFLKEKATVPLPLQAYIPRGDKRRRFMEITPMLEDERMYFHPNLDRQRNVLIADRGDLIGELLEFPLGAHDDLLDSLVVAVAGLRDFRPEGAEAGWMDGDGLNARLSILDAG
jgi:phage terminase large subunit-like protein